MGKYSAIVSEGMKRVCSDFTGVVKPLGFKRGQGRKWLRHHGEIEELIYLSRSGATYGAPASASISLQIDLSSRRGIDGPRHYLDHHATVLLRRSTGYCYHHRFNAETGSTYDRCIAELGLFLSEVAEPWFAQQR